MSDAEWLSVPDFADRLGVAASHIRELVREGELAAVRRGERNTVQLPAGFIVEIDGVPVIVPTLKGTLTLLHDGGFTDEEAIEWLLAHEEELGKSPLDALREGQRAHVRRIAQTLL
jgi:excisionase family DNA binding protein